jgi:putative membrane protein
MKLVHVFAVSAFLAIGACNSQPKDSVETAKEANEERDTLSSSDTRQDSMAANPIPVDEKDADFAVEAANGSMMEVEMGKLAESKATDPRVKNFASMMVADHTKAGEDLQKVASARNITLPSYLGTEAKRDIEKLGEKSGKDFDKAYMNMMLDDHKDDVKKFEDAAKECKDADLKNFASQTLPVLYKHLDSAKAITGKK